MAVSNSFLILSLLCHQVFCQSGLRDVEIDVDGGRDYDIFKINEDSGLDLVEGDIVYDKEQEQEQGRNSILGDQYRWPTTVPYYLESSLDVNAKALILKTFEHYRLKTCIDFKPWAGERNYISVFQGSGCYSSVGNRQVGRQGLSIGSGCDHVGTIEHEFLHALGFWHEQSRSDRDDYVTIMWSQITAGKAHNFNKYDDTVTSTLNVPYDYGSLMHYKKNAFSQGSAPTIVTKLPEFDDVIGQSLEFSDSDLLKLNRLYNCTAALTFLDSCSFELSNICGMVQGSGDSGDWIRVTGVPSGPATDHTNMGQCRGAGFFMYFNTVTGNAGSNAYLESRLFYPKRGSQCLQFYFHNSGGTLDRLNIWVREYDQANPQGTLRHIQEIITETYHSWKLHHVTLDVTKKFRVVFEGKKGEGLSSGGLSVDDINLSETACPHHQWKIKNFGHLLATSPPGRSVYSPRFLSKEGYSFQMKLYMNIRPGYLSIYFHLVSGDLDHTLQWPCPWKQVTMMLLDQNPDIRRQMTNQRSFTTDPNMDRMGANGIREYFWDDPRKVGSLVTDEDGSTFYRGPGWGYSVFISHGTVKSRDFIKGDDAIFLFNMEDVSGLLRAHRLPRADPCSTVRCGDQEVCALEGESAVCRCQGEGCQRMGPEQDPVRTVSVGGAAAVGCALAAMMIIAIVSVMQMRNRKLREQEAGMVLENVKI